MEGFSGLMHSAERRGFIKGYAFSQSVSTTHSLFVDDLLVFGYLNRNHWFYLHILFQRFKSATGLGMNGFKSVLLFGNGDIQEIQFIADFLGVGTSHVSKGFKYLGYFIKPCGYKNRDWMWILDRFRVRIQRWTHRWLSMGGRLILIQSVLSQMVVYWAHLLYIPSAIISNINSIISQFLWGGATSGRKIPLCKLSTISTPKNRDGWGILSTRAFNCALLVKSFWRAVTSTGIWNCINRAKYYSGDALLKISCNNFSFPSKMSCIWRSFKMILHIMASRLSWLFRNGSDIPIGTQNFLPFNSQTAPSHRLIFTLARNGIMYFSQLIHHWSYSAPIFKTAEQLHLQNQTADEWDMLSNHLRSAGLCYAIGGDKIIWNGPLKNNMIIVQDVYSGIVSDSQLQSTNTFFPFWKRNIPTKIILLGWLVWKRKVLTWDNLNKRSFHGPSRCVLCLNASESVDHLFFSCPSVIELWKLFSSSLLGPDWRPTDFMTDAYQWDQLNSSFRSLPFYLIWEVWISRNKIIFDHGSFQIHRSYMAIKAWLSVDPLPIINVADASHRLRPHEISLPALYFDGASAEGISGCGAWIKITDRDRILMYWNGGPGSNNKAELMALWGGLLIAVDYQIQLAGIFGDSMLIVGWMAHRLNMNNVHIQGWYDRAQYLWCRMNTPPISHIFRENNTRADRLSKQGLAAEFGLMFITCFQDGRQLPEFSIPLP